MISAGLFIVATEKCIDDDLDVIMIIMMMTTIVSSIVANSSFLFHLIP